MVQNAPTASSAPGACVATAEGTGSSSPLFSSSTRQPARRATAVVSDAKLLSQSVKGRSTHPMISPPPHSQSINNEPKSR